MDLSTLKNHIKNKTFDDFYIFTGPEGKVMQIYIDQMSKALGASVKILDRITDLAKKSHAVSFVKNACIYVLREDKDFISNSEIALKLTQNNALHDSILIFIYDTIDKRSRMYKTYQDRIIEFQPMKQEILMKYVQKEIRLSDKNCAKLIEICENDYSRILLEIDKINTYCIATNTDDADKVMNALLDAGTIYQPPYDAVFDFVDAVLRNQKIRAFKLLESSYACGEATMVLLSNLYNSAKQLLQVQSYQGTDKITDATGLTPFQVKLACERKGYNSAGDLVYLMKLVRNVEKGIKTGEIEEMTALPYILVTYWQ